MGCNCVTGKTEDEIDNQHIQNVVNQIKNNPKLLSQIRRIQSRIRGLLLRKKISSILNGEKNTLTPNVSSTRFITVANSKITEDEIRRLFQKISTIKRWCTSRIKTKCRI